MTYKKRPYNQTLGDYLLYILIQPIFKFIMHKILIHDDNMKWFHLVILFNLILFNKFQVKPF